MIGNDVLVEVKNLKVYFPVKSGWFLKRRKSLIRAVDGISFSIRRGETLGLVGESGCGKSTTGLSILQLIPSTSGEVVFDGLNLSELKPRQLLKLRRRMQIIFQDPYSSLNPRMTVGKIIGEPLLAHKVAEGKELKERIKRLMRLTGLDTKFITRHPVEFSGGQRQRIGIARALALHPDFIVADEPVSSLDVSIQAQIINLMKDLQEQFSLTYLFVSHDLSVIRYISNRVAVMYMGTLVEHADQTSLFESPLHPYTQALISAIPIPDPVEEEKRDHIFLEGDIPTLAQTISGCKFCSRCVRKQPICQKEEPEFCEKRPGHWVACHII